ncbi:hypothetical protein H2248_009257 [Termitomyces sp. 'cryptogamus']|nr:hypothetical protein H2248_009257 [Termitomyces sp. 'cryptogamus']
MLIDRAFFTIINILIFDHPNGEIFGPLMGYKHAKKAKSFFDEPENFSDGKLIKEDKSLRATIKLVKKKNRHLIVEDDLVRKAFKNISTTAPSLAADYILDSIKSYQSTSHIQKSSITKSDLRWDNPVSIFCFEETVSQANTLNQPTNQWPDFSDHAHQDMQVVGYESSHYP